MTGFNSDSLFNVEFEKDEDGGFNVHFDEDTLGFNPNTEDSGYSLTPDWNDRHFTLAFSEDSVLYHLTQEGVEDGERPGEGNLQPEAFIADVYGAVRALGPVIPIDHLELEEVGKPDFEDAEEYLRDKEVIHRTEAGVTVDKEKKTELISAMEDDHRLKYEFFERVLTSVSLEEAKESGENIFAVPGIEEVYLLFLFPDDYVGVVELREFYVTIELMADLRQDTTGLGTGSQVMNYLSRALAHED